MFNLLKLPIAVQKDQELRLDRYYLVPFQERPSGYGENGRRDWITKMYSGCPSGAIGP